MYENELEIAVKAAKKAGKYLRKISDVIIGSADGRDIKLEVDVESEKIIVDLLKNTNIPIISEECGAVPGVDKELRWIVDPLDGTANYWKGMRELSCVSIALWKDEEPVLGVIYRFETDELYYGIAGKGAFINNDPLKPSTQSCINQAVIATGFPVFMDYSEEKLLEFIETVREYKKVRMLGTAALMAVYVACGKVEVYMEDNVRLWDIAAAVSIVKAAGAYVDIVIKENNKCYCKCYANEQMGAFKNRKERQYL